MNADPRFKAGTMSGEKRECRRHRPMNAEGCKPETDILLSSAPCACAKLCRSLDNPWVWVVEFKRILQ